MATTQQLLDEALEAYHKLMTGTATRVFVDQNGERVEFAVANAPRLYNYIQDLKAKLDAENGVSPPSYGGPLQFVF